MPADNKMNIKLYFAPNTRSIRPRWLLEELGIDYELHHMELFGEEIQGREYRRIHPLGQVPAMEIDGEIMIESVAMCHWLADQYPIQGLAPIHDDPLRRTYEQWMFFLPGTLEPPLMDTLMHTVLLPQEYRVPDILPLAKRRYVQALKVLNRTLSDKLFLLGDLFSAADIVIGSTLLWAPEYLHRFETLSDYVQRLKQRPAWDRANT